MRSKSVTEAIYKRLLREAMDRSEKPSSEELRDALRVGFDTAHRVAKELGGGDAFKAAWYLDGGKLLPGDTKEAKSSLKKWAQEGEKMLFQKHGADSNVVLGAMVGGSRGAMLIDNFVDRIQSASAWTPERAWRLMDTLGSIESLVRDFYDVAKLASMSNEDALEMAAEAPPGSRLGRIAFADERSGVPKEPDTKEEKALYRALYDATFKNMTLSKKNLEIVDKILNSSPQMYSKIFRKPKMDVVRGMAVDENWIKRALGMSASEELPHEGEEDVKFNYDSNRRKNKEGTMFTSWSYDAVVAKQFAEESATGLSKGEYGVVLTASPGDNPRSFMDFESIYELGKLDMYDEQAEVLGIGPIIVKKLSWFKRA
jgi:hypothetical protein